MMAIVFVFLPALVILDESPLADRGILADVLSRITCMQPTLVREPFHRPGWIYEEKYDGWRMLAFKDGERVRLVRVLLLSPLPSS